MSQASTQKQLIYISTFLPQQIRDSILKQLNSFDNNSADVLSYSIFKGLSKNTHNFRCINVVPIGPFPRYYKKFTFKEQHSIDNGISIQSISFYDFLIYQHHSIYKNIYRSLKSSLDKKLEYKILVYSLLLPALKALVELKNEGYNIKIVPIIADFWEDMLSRPTLRDILKSKLIGDSSKYYQYCDGFVLLTKAMMERLNVERPYCVIEGMYNSEELRNEPRIKTNKIRTIFYSGMIHEKFGIRDLVEAFSRTTNPDFRLKICGSGDFESNLIEYTKKDDRIEYLGLLKRDEVLNQQVNADLLVNPRNSDGEFTKYSFPSKTIEYFASGTPTIIHRLPGIPEEYYKYCFAFKSSSIEHVKHGLEEALNESPQRLLEIGRCAQLFIFNNKNNKVQCKKILNFINSI